MQRTEIAVGRVYTNITSENRKVLRITESGDGEHIVRYQAMPWTMNPEHYLKHFGQLAPLPSVSQLKSLERIAPGLLFAETSLANFARWAKQERAADKKFNAPGQTMAAQIIEAVMRKQYTSLAAERAFTGTCSTRENYITLGPCSTPWIYTMPDGSRIAFMAPVVMAEIDEMGKPILTSHHQLDWNQSYAFGDMEKIMKAEEQLWIEANHPFS